MTLFPPPGREVGLTEGDDLPGTMQWANPSLAFQTVAHLQQPPDLQVTQDMGWGVGAGGWGWALGTPGLHSLSVPSFFVFVFFFSSDYILEAVCPLSARPPSSLSFSSSLLFPFLL